MIRSYLLDELDKNLALVGTIFSLILTIWLKLVIDRSIYVMIGVLCFIVCIGYLIIRRFLSPSLILSLEELNCSTHFYITLNILFFLLLSYSIISIYLRSDPYIRPLGYFISTALMAVILANEILFLSNQKPYICFALCKIIIIGLSLGYSQTLIFTNVIGVDPWKHQWFTLKILDTGIIPEGFGYSKMPLMHLMIGITSLVTDLGYKVSTLVSISSIQVICDALFIFLLGEFLINAKIGLLAALLLEVSNCHIQMRYWVIPNTIGATMILPIIFILFKLRKDKNFSGTLVAMFLMGTLILTHTVTAMCLTIIFYAFYSGSEAYTRLYHDENTFQPVTLTISILFSIGMLAYWTYVTGQITFLGMIIKHGFRANLIEGVYGFISEIPFLEQIFMSLGLFLFFSLSFIGYFYMISKQFINRNRVSIIIGGIVILGLSFFSLMAGNFILVGRWYYFSQILMAIPLSLSLFLLNELFKHRLIKGVLMSFLVFVLSFLLIMSPIANIDNHFFSPKSGVRYAYTNSELNAIDTISEIWNGTIGIDQFCIVTYRFKLNRELANIDNSLNSGNFTDLQDVLIIVREEILKYAFKTSKGTIYLKYDLQVALDNQNFSCIYDCGSASGYLKP